LMMPSRLSKLPPVWQMCRRWWESS
jgi:hypothetical protein